MKKLGFTLIEIIIVFGIIATLSGIIIISISSRHRGASLDSTLNQVIADFQSQQTKAMTGFTQEAVDSDSYGIYFQTNQYTLFKGASYTAGDPTNAVYANPVDLMFSDIYLPTPSVVFTRGSGEVAGYSPGENSVTVRQETSAETKTFSFNRYGIIISVQ